jgi:anti-anti-sigma regulatory factor
MTKTAILLHLDETRLAPALKEAGEKLNGAEGEAVLDFTSVRRVDAGTLRAMEEFARLADDKAIKIVLRGVNVEVYKVFKLMKLTGRFSFVN